MIHTINEGDFISSSGQPPKYNKPICIACKKSISLADTDTFMCSRCNNYFCEECAYYHNNLSKKADHSCPGYFKELTDEHSPMLVKITKNMTGPDLKGVSIKDLKIRIKDQKSSKMKIIEKVNSTKKATIKILDEDYNKKNKSDAVYSTPVKKESIKGKKPVIIDDDEDTKKT